MINDRAINKYYGPINQGLATPRHR